MNLTIGKLAPNFTLTDYQGRKYLLSDYHGQWVVLYFYPKDNTPGCTIEACAFRDNFSLYKKNKINLFGISADNSNSHEKFINKFSLPFILLSDVSREVIKKYQVHKVKNLFGKKVPSIVRRTYVIDPQGKIFKIYENFDLTKHPLAIISDIKSNQ